MSSEEEWHNNATLYRHEVRTDDYSIDLIVDYNPYEKRWNWTTTARYTGANAAAFHEFGTLDTVEQAMRAARNAMNRWRAKRKDDR
jgi:hypothetical protein